MRISNATNAMFTIHANGKAGDMENVKEVAEKFYKEGFDGAEIDDCEDGFITICRLPSYQSRKQNIELYKEFKAEVESS